MTPPPLVSILLPAFEAQETLAAALYSVERQSETRWECVVVDDGSGDGTQACAESFSRRDPRFHVLSTPHRGLVPALNAGLEHCRAPLVARMDADDLMHRRRLAEQVEALHAAPDLAGVGCHVRLQPRHARREYESWINSIDTPQRVRQEMFVECPIAHPTLVVRREILRGLGYRDCGWPEDYDLILRLLIGGHDLGVVPRRLLLWRDRPNRLSRVGECYGIERFTACKAAHLARSFLRRGDTYTLWGYGGTGRELSRALAEHGKSAAYIVDLHPRRLGNCIHGAPVIRPGGLLQIPRLPIVVSVAGDVPRQRIREAMALMGFEELRDFVFAA